MSSHNVYSLRNVFWPLGRSALQATDLLSAAYAAPVSAFCCCSELWTQKSPGTSHFIWYSGTDNLLPAVPPALQTSSSTPLCARNVCCGLPYSENTGSDSSAGILAVQTVSSGVFPIVPLPPDTALSRWPRLSVGFFETESPSLPFKKVGTNTMIIMASLPTPLDSIFYVQTINYFSEFVKRFFYFFHAVILYGICQRKNKWKSLDKLMLKW